MRPPRPLPCSLLLLLVGLASGCAAHRQQVTCPTEGGPAWRELTSAHFRMRTDMERKAADETLLQLERYRRALLLAWGEDFDPPGRVDVIALRHLSELAEFRKDISGFFASREEGPLLVITGDGGYALGDAKADLGTTLHELAHYLSRYAMPRQPRWFSEGLAGYLETVYVSADGQRVTLGRAPPHLYAYARRNYRLQLPQLWQWDSSAPARDEVARHYASSWLWVHYLLNHHEDRMADFQTRLARLEEPRAAFAQAFSGVDWGREQLELESYVRVGRASVLELPMPALEVRASERPLEAAEVHALRTELAAYGSAPAKEREAMMDREVATALREAPQSYHAQRLEAWAESDPKRQLALARALTRNHPEQSGAWKLLGEVLALHAPEAAEERAAALARGLQLAPDSAPLLNALGWHFVGRRDFSRALPLGKRAVELAPWSPEYLDTYAAALAGLGRCAAALVYQGQAVSALSEDAPAPYRKLYVDRVAEYTRCAQASASPQPAAPRGRIAPPRRPPRGRLRSSCPCAPPCSPCCCCCSPRWAAAAPCGCAPPAPRREAPRGAR